MMYQSILQRIEDQKKDEVLSTKLYRYTGLVQAIDYFSQKLIFEQIIDAAFDFINELLLVEKSAIYINDNQSYSVKKVKGFSIDLTNIRFSDNLKNLATFYGNILYEKEKIIKFFDTEVIDLLEINAVVPLIIEGNLYGFILFQKKDMTEDDYIISEALMKLINNALENFNRYEKLIKVNSELDEKIYNLFAINQSSKVLLSELRMDVLYNMSVDVFSELTSSKITGFILFDDKSQRYILKAFKDVFCKTKDVLIRLELKNSQYINPNKVIIDLQNEEDCAYFTGLFDDSSVSTKLQIEQLQAKYIVLIVKNNQILGLVTLSETVTGSKYSDGVFELIESLAASTYTALSNARLFKIVNEQKAVIQNKLDKLLSLNNLNKNISSSIRTDTLLEMVTKAMQISFNVDKGAFCLYKKETSEFEFTSTINVDQCKSKLISPNQNWKRVFEGDCIYAMGQANIAKYIGDEYADKVGDAQGIIITPVYIDMMEIELLGVLIIFGYNGLQLDNEENMLILETIAGSIAPVLNNLLIINMQQRFMLPNFIELFKSDLREEINIAKEYEINLSVIQIEDDREFLFKGNSAIENLKENFKKVYPFSYNNIFIIINGADNEVEATIKQCTKLDNLQIKRMVLGREFQNFAGFFELYR